MIPDFLTRKMMQKGEKNTKRSAMFMVKVVLNRGMGFQFFSKTHFQVEDHSYVLERPLFTSKQAGDYQQEFGKYHFNSLFDLRIGDPNPLQ